MSISKRLKSLVGSVNISRNTSLNDLGGSLARINNITGKEQLAIGINTEDYIADSILQTTLNEDIQFGGDDVTTQTIPVGGEIVVVFTNLFDARIIGHTLRLNQGRIRFHVDVKDFENNDLRVVDGNVDMDDISFADATGPDNDVAMVYKTTFIRYTEQQQLTVTFYNVGDEEAIVRGGPLAGNPAPFVPYWRTSYYDIASTYVVPNGFVGVAAEDISKGEVVYPSGQDMWLPTFFPIVSLADKDSAPKRPAFAIATEDVLTGEKGIFTQSGILLFEDTSAWSIGDILYLGNNGALLNERPTGFVQEIGEVILSDSDQGEIEVNIQSPEDGLLVFSAQSTTNVDVEVYRKSINEGETYGFTVEAIGFKDDELEAVYQTVQSLFRRSTGGSTVRVGGRNGNGVRTSDDSQSRVKFTLDGNDAVISVTGRFGETVNWDVFITERGKN